MKWAKETLEGWGRYPRSQAWLSRPEKRENLRALLEEARQEGQGFLARGLGRSYGDAALLKDGRVALSEGLNLYRSFDEATGWLECEAGVSYKDLLETFVKRGFFPPVTPGTKFVSLGGAIACDVHGKNHHLDGSISKHIAHFDLLLANGEVKRVSKEKDPELFWATVGGLGLTGVILAVKLKLTPIHSPWMKVESMRVENLDHFFEISSDSARFTHTVSWIDCLSKGKRMGRGIFMRGEHAGAGEVGKDASFSGLKSKILPHLNVPFDFPKETLNKASIRLFNEVYFRKHPKGSQTSLQHYEPFFYPLDAVQHWNRIYGDRGFLQYQMVLPHEKGQRSLRACLHAITQSGLGSFLAVIKEFGEGNPGLLSFPSPGVTLALDFPNYGKPLFKLLDHLDQLVLKAGGKVYLGKDARLDKASFQAMYPEWKTFKALKAEVDPEGLFQSDLGKRLGLL